MSLLKQCDVADINSNNYHPYATCCGKCEKFEREKPYQSQLLAQHIADARRSEIEYRLKNMKRFNALKKVNATPMTRQAYNDYRGWTLPEDENGDDEGYLTEDINGPINTDEFMGYVSWTPKAMFEDQFYECTAGQASYGPADPDHELTDDEVATLASGGSLCDCCEFVQVGGDCPIEEGDEFDFGSAIHLLKIGKKVARKGWNGAGMYVYYVPAASYPVERNNLETMGGEFENDMVPYREYLALKTAQGDVATWSPSVSDALATDWCLA
ncbi:DUF2829 domain-containing protein [Psychrobacter sp. 4Bb]|uniref:DUF2829 domain-containing protein n=1 Tax=Psychrobacter sp. 4Bb TaxID=888436 RepID=UPI001C60A238|nr:DUF2829 domain-containing protein [Psychrobacter sp. 4Bb]